MRVPCIVCKKLVEVKGKKNIATACDECNKGNLDKILKNLNYKEVEKLIPKTNKDGKSVNEYGEVL